MSSTNRVAIGLVAEVTPGTTPASPAITGLRVTSGGLTYSPQTVTSNEIRSDRQVTDLVLVGAQAAGQIGFEASYGAIDTLLEGGLASTWVNNPTILNVTADSNITDAGTTANTYAVATALGSAFKTGHVVQASGFTNSANNQIFRVTSSTATTVVGTALSLTAETAPPAGAKLQVIGFQGAAADLTITASTKKLGSTLLDFTTLGLAVGMWVKIGGTASGDKFATAANNDWCRISAIAATGLTFDVFPTFVDDTGTGKTVKVWIGDYLRNGTTEKSYSIERQYADHSPVDYEVFTGMEIDQLSLQMTAQAIMTGSASFQGLNATTSTTRTSGATDVAAPTNSVYNTSSNVGRIAENGSSIIGGANYVLDASIQIANNLRRNNAVGSLPSVAIQQGECTITGRLNTYFANTTLYAKVLANTASSFDIRVQRSDESYHTLLIDLPKLKYSGGSPQVGGKNQDVTIPLDFQSFRHPTLGYSMQVQRYAYVEV